MKHILLFIGVLFYTLTFSQNQYALRYDDESETIMTYHVDFSKIIKMRNNFIKDFPEISNISIQCIIQGLIDISMKIRSGKLKSQFPLFSITCSGHTERKGSLVRAKRLRRKIKKLKLDK